jgi:hypothetical protein
MSTPFSTADFGAADNTTNDEHKIQKLKQWVPCRICEGAFGRLRLTRRYCDTCKRGACEGEHLNFAAKNRKGRCTSCGDKALGNI